MEKISSFEEVRRNNLHSNLLLVLFILLAALMGAALGLVYDSVVFGMVSTTFISLIYAGVMLPVGDKVILAMSGAKPIAKKEYPFVFHTIEGLALASGLPVPKAYVIEDSALNAFATGTKPENASITLTTGLIEKLKRDELEGVIAHEMSHIKNLDVKYMLYVTILVGITTLVSDFLLRSLRYGGDRGSRRRDSGSSLAGVLIMMGIIAAILTPLIVQLIRFAISRKKEFAADAGAAILTRYPPGLANALRKIKADPDPMVDRANRAIAHLFISSPLSKENLSALYATHPPIEERIRRLEAM